MKKCLTICICLLTLVSCKIDKSDMDYWGIVNYFDDFLWCKYVPDTIQRILKVDFNEDAFNELKGDLVFDLYQRLSDDKYSKVTPDEVELYVNGLKSDNNMICIRIENCDTDFQQLIKVGIVLTEKTLSSLDIDRDYHYVLKMIETPGIDRINNCVLYSNSLLLDENIDTQTPVVVKVKHISNRLRVWLDTILSFIGILIICATVIWFLILKGLNFPKLNVAIDINGAYYLHKSKNRYRMIVLCDSSYDKRQSYLNKLFTGEIYYSVNDMWSDGPVSIVPSGKNVRIKLDGNEKYTIKPYDLTLEKDVEYKITNSSKQSIQIVIS